MINIDQVIDTFTQRWWKGTGAIARWSWRGSPDAVSAHPYGEIHTVWCVMYIIQCSTDDECLQSKSEYVRETKAWLNSNATTLTVNHWTRGLGQYVTYAVSTMQSLRSKPKPCCCGAKHTSFPNIHSSWCDAFQKQ